MTSEAGDSPNVQASQVVPSQAIEEARIQRIFRLVEDMVPLELCLQYGVLPLRLKGDCLHLGMVQSSNIQGLEAVRRVLAANNCFPSARTIPPQLHRLVLKAFLVHRQGQHKQAIELVTSVLSNAAGAAILAVPGNGAQVPTQVSPQNRVQNPGQNLDRPSSAANLSATLIVDRPDCLDARTLSDLLPPALTEEDQQTVSRPAALPTLRIAPTDTESFPGVPTLRGPIPPPSSRVGQVSSAMGRSPLAAPPVLAVSTQHLASSPATLAVLPPKSLLQELLGRALLAGITYLEFDNQGDRSRILWNQSGVLQPLLTELSSYQLNGVLDCLYQSLNANRSQPIAMLEYQYQNQAVILDTRCQGSTTALRLLKGAALRFYQQQQASQLKQESMLLIEQLRCRLEQLSHYRQSNDLELAAQSRSTFTVLQEQLQGLLA
jgi:Type II secretion system (T2SS), protein E, N-terminal domain